MIWLLAHLPLSLTKLYRRHTGRLRKERQLADGRVGEGVGEEPTHTTAINPGPLQIIQYSLTYIPSQVCPESATTAPALARGPASCAACTLQRQNTEISKQIFPEKEYRGLSPNFHIHASVSDLYIPTIGLPILLEEIYASNLELYKSHTDT
jgi:hypothetical protein